MMRYTRLKHYDIGVWALKRGSEKDTKEFFNTLDRVTNNVLKTSCQQGHHPVGW
jgi:hypothetical protein